MFKIANILSAVVNFGTLLFSEIKLNFCES